MHPVIHNAPTVVVQPAQTSWLDYVTAFGTVAAAVVAGLAAVASLLIAAQDRKAAEKAVLRQLTAADDALNRQNAASAARDAVERDANLLIALAEQLGEMRWGSNTPQFHPARAKAIALYQAVGGSERLPALEAAFSGTATEAALEPAAAAVAAAIRDLPR